MDGFTCCEQEPIPGAHRRVVADVARFGWQTGASRNVRMHRACTGVGNFYNLYSPATATLDCSMSRPRRPRSIRAHLIGLLLAGLVPVAAFAAVLLLQLWVGQRDEVRSQHEGAVNALATVVERELEGGI